MSSPDPDCIFCKIVRRDAPASVVYEDDTTLAFMDLRPVTAGHTLVIPKAHGAYLEDLPEGGVAFLFTLPLTDAAPASVPADA